MVSGNKLVRTPLKSTTKNHCCEQKSHFQASGKTLMKSR